jgi:hypothetical protein
MKPSVLNRREFLAVTLGSLAWGTDLLNARPPYTSDTWLNFHAL